MDNDELLRRYDSEKLDKYISMLVGRLNELRDKTSPDSGVASAKGKDLAAFQALKFAGKLVQALAGWAIDHQIGLAAEELKFVPLQPSGTQDHPEYIEARATVDDHRHERRGAAIRAGLEDLDPVAARKLLLNLINPNPGGFPSKLTSMLGDALKALDYGEVRPLVSPTMANRKVNLREQQLQLRAIGFIYYRTARGAKKYVAIRQVADVYGVGEETIRSWEKRLREELGSLQVQREISFARNAASQEEAAIKGAYQGDEFATPGLWEERYGAEALREAAQAFRLAQRENGAEI
jgi:hypothetical protein